MGLTALKPDIALYQPDIPGNTGTILRFAACLGLNVNIIEPAGFRLDDKNLKRAGMDYLELASLARHTSFTTFERWRKGENRRLICLTTKAANPYTAFEFQSDDIILFGRESAGLPDDVHNLADARLTIPMIEGARSLNLALSVSMVMGEVVRQVG